MSKNSSTLCLTTIGVLVTAGLISGTASTLLAHANPQTNTPNQTSAYSELAQAPAKAKAMRNPLETDRDAPRAGEKLFDQYCSGCHGRNASGSKKAPGLQADAIRSAAPGALFWLLTNGVVRKGMPVWSKLPEAQRWQIVVYLRSLQDSQLHR